MAVHDYAAMRVLYIHPIRTYGGSTKSLVELVRAFPEGAVRATVVIPAGEAAAALADAGMEIVPAFGVAQWDNTRFGHYRGLRWLILLRELAYLPATILAIRRAARHGPFDLIHCNEITAFPVGLFARCILQVPLVVHVRSLQRTSARGRLTACMWRLIRMNVTTLIAIDEAVRRTIPSNLVLKVIHNGMRVPEEPVSSGVIAPFCAAIVGVLHRAKGVYEFVQAVRVLRDRGVKIRALVVGGNARRLSRVSGWLLGKLNFAHDVRRDLERYVSENSLADAIEFTGFIRDMRAIYSVADVICFPSHLDAPGRPVFEAALFGLPTIVAMRNPTDDVIVPGRTGLCIDNPTPAAIADAIESLAKNRVMARTMGAEARRRALSRFDSRICAAKVLQLYKEVALGSASDGKSCDRSVGGMR